MNCLHCGADNPERAKFCIECGTPLQRRCPSCDFENLSRAKFCAECGTSLTGEMTTPIPTQEEPPTQIASPPTEPHTPDAERRQLTILFTDLVDSTKLSGQLDAEDYREIVRAYQVACTEIIDRFDCHLAQTLGDGLLIYSGYPIAHENDAERAVRVGLGILDAMRDLNANLEKDNDIRLAVRVGIHTGPVVVGDVGAGARPEQLALGEVPNVAARIQGLAEPDTIVISDATYRLVQGYFEFASLGERELRGVTEPITVHRILGESGIQSRLDIARGHGLTPLVGREQETGLLIQRWEQVKKGQGQVVLLSGEAGIGKSRLVQALKDHVSADGSHVRLECRSSPYFSNSALYPIIDMVQRTLQFQTDDPPETKLAKLEENLSQYRLPTDETVPLLASLLSVPVPEDRYPSLNLTPQRQRQKTLEAIMAITLELSERQPVLFILEDAHWHDPSTNELLELLINQTPTASLLILITYRPEFQPVWGNRSYLTQVALNRLSQNQVEQIATQVASGKTLPTEVIEQLVDRTDGVPLYIEEMTKTVLESGSLKAVDGQYELVGSLTSVAIPATLQDSLMARLDRLVTAKGVAQYASVIGRQFSYELLQSVSGLDEATLQRELSRLVEAELVYQRGLPPQATYQFKHALIVDASYQSLLRSTRQQYHQRIAQVLEDRFPETAEIQPELLGHHFTEAGLGEQAVGYWQRAGDFAIEHSAYQEAFGHYNRGIEILNTLPKAQTHDETELALQTSLASTLFVLKGQASIEIERVYSRIRELCQGVGDSPKRFSLLRMLGMFYNVRAEYHTANEIGGEMLALAQSQNDPALILEAHRALGATLLYKGDVVPAQNHLEQGIVLCRTHSIRSSVIQEGLDVGLSCVLYSMFTLWSLGYPEQAVARMHESLNLAYRLAQPFSLAWTQCFVARFLQWNRQIHTAREQIEASIALCNEHNFSYYVAVNKIVHGWIEIMRGQGETYVSQMLDGLSAQQTLGGVAHRAYFLSLLAEAYDRVGQSQKALDTMDEAFELMEKHDERSYEAEAYRFKGRLLLQSSLSDTNQAESCFHQAIAIAQNQSAKSWELRSATSLARLWHEQGKRDEARELLGDIYGWFTEGFDTADLIDAKALLDELSEGR